MEHLLRCTLEANAECDAKLPIVEYAYDTSATASTRISQYAPVYARPPVTLVDIATNSNLELVLRNFAGTWDATGQALRKAQQEMKKQADIKRADVTFHEGDVIVLATRNIDLAVNPTAKLKPRWIGQFRSAEKKSDLVYR